MAHAPEMPTRYVCTECQALFAGTVVEGVDSGHKYEPPERCSACDATDFVAFTRYARRMEEAD